MALKQPSNVVWCGFALTHGAIPQNLATLLLLHGIWNVCSGPQTCLTNNTNNNEILTKHESLVYMPELSALYRKIKKYTLGLHSTSKNRK